MNRGQAEAEQCEEEAGWAVRPGPGKGERERGQSGRPEREGGRRGRRAEAHAGEGEGKREVGLRPSEEREEFFHFLSLIWDWNLDGFCGRKIEEYFGKGLRGSFPEYSRDLR